MANQVTLAKTAGEFSKLVPSETARTLSTEHRDDAAYDTSFMDGFGLDGDEASGQGGNAAAQSAAPNPFASGLNITAVEGEADVANPQAPVPSSEPDLEQHPAGVLEHHDDGKPMSKRQRDRAAAAKQLKQAAAKAAGVSASADRQAVTSPGNTTALPSVPPAAPSISDASVTVSRPAPASASASTQSDQADDDNTPSIPMGKNPNGNNLDTFDKMITDAKSLGRDSAAGADARPKLFIRTVKAAFHGAVDSNKPGKGDKDHAAQIYDAYIAAESSKQMHGEGTKKAKASNLRAAIKLGERSDIDGYAVITRAAMIHQKCRKEEVKVWPAWDAYYNVAIAQLDASAELSDAEIVGAMSKADGDPKDAAHYLRQAAKALEQAGKLSSNGDIVTALDMVSSIQP